MSGIKEKRDDNPMWKHVWELHGGEGEESMFQMRMEKGFTKPLARQIMEGVEIEMSQNRLMNSKSEWNNARIPRIIIEEGDKLTEDKTSGLGRVGEIFQRGVARGIRHKQKVRQNLREKS